MADEFDRDIGKSCTHAKSHPHWLINTRAIACFHDKNKMSATIGIHIATMLEKKNRINNKNSNAFILMMKQYDFKIIYIKLYNICYLILSAIMNLKK